MVRLEPKQAGLDLLRANILPELWKQCYTIPNQKKLGQYGTFKLRFLNGFLHLTFFFFGENEPKYSEVFSDLFNLIS